MKNYNIKQIADDYFNKKHTITEISKITNIPFSTIKYQLKKHGYILENKSHAGNNRRHNIDINFFKKIDSKNKAYILGLIISDGYVDNNYKLTLTSKDLDLVEIFKKELKSEHKLARYDIFDKRTNNIYCRYSLQVASKEIVNDLNKLGIFANKSFNCTMPNIPQELIWHFIRGVFDGDGTIHQPKNNKLGRLRFSIIGSEKLLVEINNHFKNNGIHGVFIRKTNYDNPQGNLIKLDCTKFQDINTIKNFLYKDSEGLKLSRKYELFQTLKEYKRGTYDRTHLLKRIDMYENTTKKYIKTYENIHKLTTELKTKTESIYRVLRGERNHYKGYFFKYH
jgi:hypothetical protein